jgi:hypothetical protein
MTSCNMGRKMFGKANEAELYFIETCRRGH